MRNLPAPILLCLFLFCFVAMAKAQKLPASNIYLFEFNVKADSLYTFSKPAYLTSFNPLGYNNQPCFFNENELYFTVQLSDDTTQTDIYAVNLKKKTLSQVTATTESEYSAQPTRQSVNNIDGKKTPQTFTCVRVEADGITQRIWEFPVSRSNNGKPLLPSITNVGYYIWLAQNGLAVFLVGDPHQLAIVNKINEDTKNVTSNIGRSLQKMPNGPNIAFVHKLGRNWVIKQLDPLTNRIVLHTGVLPGSEDFVVLPDGTLLMGNGSKLYKFRKGIDSGWEEVGDFASFGIDNITRLAVQGNRIAIVDQ